MRATELSLHDVVAGYGGTTVLEGISLSVKRGERVGIIGRNGAGKTTTLATALGLTQQLAGQVMVDGCDVSCLATPDRARLGIGYVPQTRDIFASLTVEDNLRSGLQGGPQSRLDQAYALFPRLKERRRNHGNELSGGEQQMLSIARALMSEPSILLMDEPLEGLSPLVAHEVMTAIDTLVSDRGLGCVLVEQHVALVLDFASTVLLLERGRPMFLGDSATLSNRPDLLERCIGLRKAEANPVTA
jgi:branched-chain amino acid transport system ATP-binding protein